MVRRWATALCLLAACRDRDLAPERFVFCEDGVVCDVRVSQASTKDAGSEAGTACPPWSGTCGDGACGCGEYPVNCPADCGTEAELVAFAADTFAMGSASPAPSAAEQPQHTVSLSAFRLERAEVTVAQYERFYAQVGAAQRCSELNISSLHCLQPGDGPKCNWNVPWRNGHPINCVDWFQATAYCAWAHVGGRLPTEAEWEYAATSRGLPAPYPWGSATDVCERAVAKGSGCAASGTVDTCSLSKGNSAQGLCDLAGNVWEWTADRYAPYTAAAVVDPKGGTTSSEHVLRGGSWQDDVANLRSRRRNYNYPDSRNDNYGFRCAAAVAP